MAAPRAPYSSDGPPQLRREIERDEQVDQLRPGRDQDRPRQERAPARGAARKHRRDPQDRGQVQPRDRKREHDSGPGVRSRSAARPVVTTMRAIMQLLKIAPARSWCSTRSGRRAPGDRVRDARGANDAAAEPDEQDEARAEEVPARIRPQLHGLGRGVRHRTADPEVAGGVLEPCAVVVDPEAEARRRRRARAARSRRRGGRRARRRAGPRQRSARARARPPRRRPTAGARGPTPRARGRARGSRRRAPSTCRAAVLRRRPRSSPQRGVDARADRLRRGRLGRRPVPPPRAGGDQAVDERGRHRQEPVDEHGRDDAGVVPAERRSARVVRPSSTTPTPPGVIGIVPSRRTSAQAANASTAETSDAGTSSARRQTSSTR